MRLYTVTVAVVVASVFAYCKATQTQDAPKERTVLCEELHRTKVMGLLGIEVGTVVTVNGFWRLELEDFEFWQVYITSVDGVPLTDPVRFPVSRIRNEADSLKTPMSDGASYSFSARGYEIVSHIGRPRLYYKEMGLSGAPKLHQLELNSVLVLYHGQKTAGVPQTNP